MDKRLAVVIIHGIGRQTPGFADGTIKAVSAHLAERGQDPDHIAWQPVYWDDILEPAQQAYLSQALAAVPLNSRRLRGMVVSALGDATGYRQLPSRRRRGGEEVRVYRLVHARIQACLAALYRDQLHGRPVPLVMLAHSFGGHILSNYIWDSQRRPTRRLSNFERMNWLTGFITFGCNIPLFTFACRQVIPISFPPPRLPARLKPSARWLNYYDPHDVLAWPLKPVNAAYERTVQADIAINVGGPLSGRTPFSHLQYWTDPRFTREVADYLLTLF